MAYEDSVTYKWADEAETIVRRTRVDHPANLIELQMAIDEGRARIVELPEPEPYPTQEQYDEKWADTGLSFDEVCTTIDRRNDEDPDVQERLLLERSVEQWEQDIIDWRAKVNG